MFGVGESEVMSDADRMLVYISRSVAGEGISMTTALNVSNRILLCELYNTVVLVVTW